MHLHRQPMPGRQLSARTASRAKQASSKGASNRTTPVWCISNRTESRHVLAVYRIAKAACVWKEPRCQNTGLSRRTFSRPDHPRCQHRKRVERAQVLSGTRESSVPRRIIPLSSRCPSGRLRLIGGMESKNSYSGFPLVSHGGTGRGPCKTRFWARKGGLPL